MDDSTSLTGMDEKILAALSEGADDVDGITDRMYGITDVARSQYIFRRLLVLADRGYVICINPGHSGRSKKARWRLAHSRIFKD